MLMKLNIDKKAYMIDQVTALDLPTRKVVRQLYEAAFNIVDKPLCLAAAEKILAETSGGDSAFIVTGFPIVPKNLWETDGPPGAAVLAEVLQMVRLKPLLITDNGCVEILRAVSPNMPVLEFPVNDEQAGLEGENLISKFNPSVLIAIERPGWNEKHEYHNMKGQNISDWVGKTDYLFYHGRKSGIATVAVGDGGNELGCGAIAETVRRYVPYGARCQCPCSGGIAAATPADVLVISGVSNWGSYGIAACLSLLKNLDYKHDGENELRLLKRIVNAGAIDGVTTESKPFVDGVSTSINNLVVNLIWAITNM
jgi:hypothetical protein